MKPFSLSLSLSTSDLSNGVHLQNVGSTTISGMGSAFWHPLDRSSKRSARAFYVKVWHLQGAVDPTGVDLNTVPGEDMSCLAELLERHGGVEMEGETTPFVRRDEYCNL